MPLMPRIQAAADNSGPDPALADPVCWVAKVLAVSGEYATVRIDGYDGGRHAFGPYPYTPRDAALPVPGSTAWVLFDDQGGGVIVGWV